MAQALGDFLKRQGDLSREVERLQAQLDEVRLLAELWLRSSNDYARMMGADLRQLVDDDG